LIGSLPLLAGALQLGFAGLDLRGQLPEWQIERLV
jgi:hypothetical protein